MVSLGPAQPAIAMTDLAAPDAASTRLEIVRRIQPSAVTLVLDGEIDLASAPALERELLDVETGLAGRVVLDLGGLDFIDSTGIHLLVDAQQRADANAHELVLSQVPDHAERLFRLTGVVARFTLE